MTNTILLDKYETFIGEVATDIPKIIEIDNEILPELFHDFKYPISSWPIMLDREKVINLKAISLAIPRLQQLIPSLYFNNNVKEMADFYFGGDEMAANFSLMCHNKNYEVSCRLDLTLTETGFKVLEVNMGSSLGGMEFQNFEPLIRRMHPQLSDSGLGTNYISQPTQTIYMEFLVDKILEYHSGNLEEVNILIATAEGDEERLTLSIEKFFNGLVVKELQSRGLRGKTVSGRIPELKLSGNQLTHKGETVHAVLILNAAIKDISPDLFRACMMDRVYFPDHLGTTFLKDKSNLSLLRKLASAGKFSDRDNRLVLDCVPWTEVVEEKKVSFQSKDYDMMNLLREFKDQFVVKVACGLQGKDVFVGRFLSSQQWEKVLDQSLKGEKYIAQEYCKSVDLLAPGSSDDWVPHSLVWGAFGFGQKYGGVWVRMSSKERDTGVINSATGAVEAIVYEC